MWRQGNAPQQFGKDLGPIAFLQGVELLEELLGGLRHEIRVPSSRFAVKGMAIQLTTIAEQTGSCSPEAATPGALSATEFVANLWTTGVHDHAETGAKTRLPA